MSRTIDPRLAHAIALRAQSMQAARRQGARVQGGGYARGSDLSWAGTPQENFSPLGQIMQKAANCLAPSGAGGGADPGCCYGTGGSAFCSTPDGRPVRARRTLLAIPEQVFTAPAGAPPTTSQSQTITIYPPQLFRGLRLAVPSTISDAFAIEQLRVNNTLLLLIPANGVIPARILSEVGDDSAFIQTITAGPSSPFYLQVRYTGAPGSSATFSGAILGDTVDCG